MYLSRATDDMQIIFLLLTPIYFPWKKNPKPNQTALLCPPTAEKGCVNVSGRRWLCNRREQSGISARVRAGMCRDGDGRVWPGQMQSWIRGRAAGNGSTTPPLLHGPSNKH